VTAGCVLDDRSPLPPLAIGPLRAAPIGSHPIAACKRVVLGRAWNQNFTNSGNEGIQNANNKDNTNNSVRPVRRPSLWLCRLI